MNSLAPILQEYFTAYLVTQRAMSDATVRAYRDTWTLFLRFLADAKHVNAYQLQIIDIDTSSVLAFLDYLERQRGNSVGTRNVRLAAIKSVMAFYAARAPELLDTVARIHAIPVKRRPKPGDLGEPKSGLNGEGEHCSVASAGPGIGAGPLVSGIRVDLGKDRVPVQTVPTGPAGDQQDDRTRRSGRRRHPRVEEGPVRQDHRRHQRCRLRPGGAGPLHVWAEGLCRCSGYADD